MLPLSSKNHSPKISVVCGFALLGESIADSMELRELDLHLKNSLQIIFDADWTFALTTPIDASKTSIIITDNPCPAILGGFSGHRGNNGHSRQEIWRS
jgi:hypothetical protein